jgi:hypothetical protein
MEDSSMRVFAPALTLLVLGPLLGSADEPVAKPDYRELSKLIHQQVAKKLPKEVEKEFGWGATIPVPPKLPLPRLRKYVKVGDRLEVPHGAWSLVRGKIEDPDKNLVIQVRDFRQLEPTLYRVAVDADATIATEAEWQQWQKGLPIFGATALADAEVRLALVCDVRVSFDVSAFPPALNLEPKVSDLQLDLKALNLRQLGNRIVQAENPKELGARFEDIFRQALKQSEPKLKELANEALAKGLREGKGSVAPGELFKAVPPPAKK